MAQVAAVAAGLAILAAAHFDFWNRSLLKSAAVAVGLALVAAWLIAASRAIG
ncbi:MAG: hypothetical protein J0H42_12925 [Rhizobiales bacterium]|nr:hypothetical protein [Hyphomicrobiales bacterium]